MVDCRAEIDKYLKRLFPITRSITGEGNRETLRILQEIVPLDIIEYPSGQQVYDWQIPQEWHIADAWIKNSKGEKVVDFQESNLHVVSYSAPVHEKMRFSKLKEHLHYLPDLPEAIPYRTSYYDRNWGFCLSYDDYMRYFNDEEEYEVYIDAAFSEGALSVGELKIEGKSSEEYLLSCYICHPSMANDSLSGVVATAIIARELLQKRESLEHSYRIIFVPETIGAISYCANNEKAMQKIKAGLVLTTCGGPGKFGYKQTWQQEHFLNAMVEEVFKENGIEYCTYPFDIHGSDERQYSSQGFRINCTTISKDKYYEYEGYHNSLDDLTFVTAENLNRSVNLYLQLLEKMDRNITYQNLYPNCEVMLSKHDLYPKTGGAILPGSSVSALDMRLWCLFYMDGKASLHEISQKIGVPIEMLYEEVKILEEKNTVIKVTDG